MTLDAVPNIDFLKYVPRILDGLLRMLGGEDEDIRRAADQCLSEFLLEIETAAKKWEEIESSGVEITPEMILPSRVDYGAIVEICLPHCVTQDMFIAKTALRWIQMFIIIGKENIIPYVYSVCFITYV